MLMSLSFGHIDEGGGNKDNTLESKFDPNDM